MIEYTVRRRDRARRVRVAVDPEKGVEVVLPQRAPKRAAAEAIRELRPWIERRLEEAERGPRSSSLQERGLSPFLQRRSRSSPRSAARGSTARATRSSSRHGTRSPPSSAGTAAWRAPRSSRGSTTPTAALGTTYSALTIRNQKTRWGSCSSTGAMSFNWRLLLAPEDVLDYVVWHEACHLLVLDHSPRFWSLLATHVPDYAEPRRWLRRHGQTLVL